MGDIEELVDLVLTGQHPKLRERCIVDRIVSGGGARALEGELWPRRVVAAARPDRGRQLVMALVWKAVSE